MKATDRHKLIDRIKTIEGLTDDERSTLLGLLREHKTYGLVWEDKPEAVEERLREELPILQEVKDRALISKNPEAPNHILIEGDNLEALTTLAYTHEGKIDVIYIDPPYNTGNKDFIYNDSYVDSEDSYRHSKWLSFMSRRLKIAKKLLSDRGVIFISIDDNEQANLKLLCDSPELFGEKNFVGTFFWKRTSTPPALSYKIRRKLEFVLCYQRSTIPQRTFAQGYVDGGDAPLLNSGNPRGILNFPIGSVHFNLPDGIYSHNSAYKIELIDNVEVVNGLNANKFRAAGNFKWGQSNLEREVSKGTYFLIKSKQFSPRFQKASLTTKVPSNIIDEEVNVGTNEDAQKEILGFSLSSSFDYAKPSSLVAYLTKMPFWKEQEITILDFFAGSGTTLHAVMQLNAEDGGKRQCILCTNNENKICENVTYERNKRVINGYTKPNGEHVEGLHDNNLRYYKTDFISRTRTMKNMHKLVALATDMLCIKENLYTEQKRMNGVRTHHQIFRYFDDGNKQMLIIYREEYIEEIVGIIEKMDIKNPMHVYVFSPSEDPATLLFESVEDKVRLTALPAAIYNVYKRILPKKRDKVIFVENEKEDNETESIGGLFGKGGEK
ncbi:MAG: site-specific DNA-methyltransferase [Bacteroides sp.]|nr:site-specific DNA-methyltransferase [Bacteroides sp.]